MKQNVFAICFSMLLVACGGDSFNEGSLIDRIDPNQPGNSSGYLVRGSLSGANGTVKIDNNGSEISLTKNGAFQLENNLPSGVTLNLEITEVPDHQTCSFDANVTSSYSFTIDNADVTDIDITCINDPTYTVSGTVSDIGGGALKHDIILGLEDGNDNNLAGLLVSEGSTTFNFSYGLYDGEEYKIVVQDDLNYDDCDVSMSSGTINGTNVTNVSIQCHE